MANPRGKESTFTQEKFDYIIEQISTTSRNIRQICREDKAARLSEKENHDLPTYQTFYNWLNERPHLFDPYSNARKMQTHLLIDETLEIIDDKTGDILESEGKNGGTIKSSHTANVARDDMRVKYRHKLAALLNSRGYGPSSTVSMKGLDAKDVTKSVQATLKQLQDGEITVDEATKIMNVVGVGAEAIYKHETADKIDSVINENT